MTVNANIQALPHKGQQILSLVRDGLPYVFSNVALQAVITNAAILGSKTVCLKDIPGITQEDILCHGGSAQLIPLPDLVETAFKFSHLKTYELVSLLSKLSPDPQESFSVDCVDFVVTFTPAKH
jgi:hypothetical protein